MPIQLDDAWLPALEGAGVKHVYRDGNPIGRIRRWQSCGDDELTREWFTAERMEDGEYVLIEGEQADIEVAFDRIVLHGAPGLSVSALIASMAAIALAVVPTAILSIARAKRRHRAQRFALRARK